MNRSKVEWWSYFAVILVLFAAGVLTILDGDTMDGFQWIAMSGLFGMVGVPR